MRLKRLDIHGFKSFADRTTIHFNEGITCVVGPNGCGKSNIVDSLRWCMGEQSAKHLRGDAMQDVIFNGSETRGQSGMAEVSLTFINEGDVSGEWSAYPEITVTRRLYRDGTSEYLINKQEVRLKDIQDIVLGTGVGTKGYSIIEQGRIGLIVSSKAEDRRRLIEEAAGITKYKARRQAAERKMDATRQNLLRVGDLVTELGKRLGQLRRQAAKAEKYKALKSELRELELHDAALAFLRVTALLAVERQGLSALDEDGTGAAARLAVLEAEGEVQRLNLMEDEKRIGELQGQVYGQDQALRLLEQQAAHKEESAQQLLRRADESEDEQQAQRGRITALAEEGTNLQKDLDQLAQEETSFDDVLADAQAAAEEVKGQRDEVAAQFEEYRLRHAQLTAQETAAQTTLGQLSRRMADVAEREARARGEQENLEAEGDAIENSRRLGEASVGARREEKIQLEQQRLRMQQELGQASERFKVVMAQVNQVQEDLGRRRQKLHALEEVHKGNERAPEGVRTVLDWSRQGRVHGVIGVLGDGLSAPAEYEAAVAGAFGPHLDDMVVKDVPAAVSVAELLVKEGKGRVTFMPAEARNPHAPRAAVNEDGVRGWLLDLVSVEPRLRAPVEARLGDVLVVRDLKVAQRLFEKGVRARMVTLAGDLLGHMGEVVGGTGDEGAQVFLRQKREMTELAEQARVLEEKLRDLDDQRAESGASVEELTAREREIAEETQTIALRLLEAEKDLHRLQDQEARLRVRNDALMAEMARIAEQSAQLRAEEQQHQETLERATGEKDRLEYEMQAMSERVAMLTSQYNAANERALELKVRAQTARQRREQLERAIQGNARARKDVEDLLTRLQQQALQSREQAAFLVGQATTDRENALRQAAEVSQLRTALDADRARYEEMQARVAALELEARGLRSQLTAAQEALGQARTRIREYELELVHLQDRIRERYQLDLRDALHDFHLRPLPAGDHAERLQDLRRQVDGMGEVNLTAIDECRDVEERHTFLCNQQDDLTHALNQLEKAIQKINKTTRRRFQEAFESINEKFQAVFPRLFRGGKAWLQLTNPENMLETGVEIFAQPPGKKVSTVQLLSGGEKALTAVSLVFSIFLIKPSPFCLLDEVDAPLDEANVGRFNELVKDVSSLSQFIVITHNKKTMEIADNIYGITMEQPGVSKLVNVRVNLAELQSSGPPPLQPTMPPVSADAAAGTAAGE